MTRCEMRSNLLDVLEESGSVIESMAWLERKGDPVPPLVLERMAEVVFELHDLMARDLPGGEPAGAVRTERCTGRSGPR